MKFFINHRSGVPIYLQLIQQIEKGMAANILIPGEQLPTVRELALELTINPNTVARAYRELEARGLITSHQGRGTFVASNIVANPAQKEKIITAQISELVREAGQLGITPARLKELFTKCLEEQKGGPVMDE
ncbi:MAG TPA: GntR family transcriptional regulator [Firmicutes bacterium]|nr:GntR family transcriptional regulator [Bacillota bacterium]